MNSSKNEIMDLIENITSKLMIVNERSKSRLFTIKKTLDSTDPHHPMYADLVKESEKQEIFFEKIFTNRIIEDFRGHSNSKSDSSKNQKQNIEKIEQRFHKMIEELKQNENS